MEMNWFIETWAVRDGIAFVTQREEGAPDAEPALTVALHPPYWDPIAISNPATALRALVHGYQHRLYDEEGEIAFRTLDEVKEVVRRGYTGGGLGFSPGPGPGLAPIPGEGGPERPFPHLNRDASGGEGWTHLRETLATIQTSRENALDLLQSYVRSNDHRIVSYHASLATAYVPWLSSLLRDEETTSIAWGVAPWICEMVDDRVWDDLIRHQLHPHTSMDYRAAEWLHDCRYYRWRRMLYRAGAVLHGKLFQIPMPFPPRRARIATLGELLLAASTSRDFVRTAGPDELFLLLFIALIVVRSAEDGRWSWWSGWRRDMNAATEWLIGILPGVLPPAHRAEALLDQLVR